MSSYGSVNCHNLNSSTLRRLDVSLKPMRFLILSVFLILTAFSSDILACSCAWSDPAGAYNRAKLVFVGTMVGGTEKHLVEAANGKIATIESGVITFNAKKFYKGKADSKLTVNVESYKGTSCGTYGLARGADYIVYANESETEPNVYWTGVCSRTAQVSEKGAR